MKRFAKSLALLLAVLMMVSCGVVSAVADADYTPGTYTASAKGMESDVSVTMTFSETAITDVKVDVSGETPTVGGMAGETLTEQLMKAQSAEIDGYTGATVTSTAAKKAAQACIDQAMGLAEAAGEKAAEDLSYEADVIIIGSGAAGLTAAIEAADNGASVIVLESQAVAGGTTNFSAAHYYLIDKERNSVEGYRTEEFEETLKAYLDKDPETYPEEYRDYVTTVQEQITDYLESDDTTKFDSIERWVVDHYDNCYGTDMDGVASHVDFDLTNTAYEATEETYTWILDQGITFEDEEFDVRGLSPVGGGAKIVETLLGNVEKRGVRVDYNTEAHQLLTDANGKVNGVVATTPDGEVTYTANNGVILCTGGYGSNSEMLAEVQNTAPCITEETPSAEGAGCTGLGITMAQELGADTVDLQFIELFGYTQMGACPIENTFPLKSAAVLWLDHNGEKFAESSKEVNSAAKALDHPYYYAILPVEDAEAMSCYDYHLNLGSIKKFDTVADAAADMGVDADTLQAQFDAYNETAEEGKALEGPFYVAYLANCVQDTPGGVVINTNAQVMDTEGNPIEGLYAAGEVCGGMEGKAHAHGDNYQEIFYYARTAAQQAAAND